MKQKRTVEHLVKIALFSALISVGAWITVPLPIPFTLQLLFVFSAVGILGCRDAVVSVLVYLLLGAIGVPVFSGFHGGLSALLGPTGGYLFGFAAAALTAGVLAGKAPSFLRLFFSMLGGLAVCYLFGSLWFALFFVGKSFLPALGTAFIKCVLPFILPDTLKILVASLLSVRINRQMKGEVG